MNMGITGPHYTLGAACAAGNAGLIQGAQMLRLDECDLALAGGVSESVRTFGIFASFKSQGALASHDDPTRASRPFDIHRNGIVVAEGGCLFVLERLEDAPPPLPTPHQARLVWTALHRGVRVERGRQGMVRQLQ